VEQRKRNLRKYLPIRERNRAEIIDIKTKNNMTIISLIMVFGVGFITGMYSATQIEKSINKNIDNPNKWNSGRSESDPVTWWNNSKKNK
jgi:hypothetical protein